MDFLKFNHQYGVLVCLECKYAVQKNALESHLLRHKIYRGERRRLLLSLSKHSILEPEDVQLPTPNTPPIGGLPVIQGYRCTSPGCDNMCASIKRMRRHWSESHGVSDPPESCCRPANLQTFFRGTKLKYFEISMIQRPEMSTHPPVSTPPASSVAQEATLSGGMMDLDTLKYFHHFITMTAITLPVQNSARNCSYWQTQVVPEALNQSWMMSGLLGIASSHLAAVSSVSDKQPHLGKTMRYFADFDIGLEAYRRNPASLGSNFGKIGSQVDSLRQLCVWLFDLLTPPAPFTLQTFVDAIRGCADTGSCPVPGGREGNNTPGSPSDVDTTKIPRELFKHLQNLPYRMSLVVGKPKSTLDFLATLSAVDSLSLGFSLSHSAEDAVSAWAGMATWLVKISEHFIQLVWCQNTAALVVLWHWSLLVDRAEQHFWFLNRCGERIRQHLLENLSKTEGIRGLIGQ